VSEENLRVGDQVLGDSNNPVAVVVGRTKYHFQLQFGVDGSIKAYDVKPGVSYSIFRLNAVLRDLARVASC
jgi:hypothetical protein